MSKVLITDELLGALIDVESPGAYVYQQMLENLTHLMATELAGIYSLVVHSFELTAAGGVVTAFRPMYPGQPWPLALEPYDPTGDFE